MTVERSGGPAAEKWESVLTDVDARGDRLGDETDDQAVQATLDEANPQAAAVWASVAALNTAICRLGGATTTNGS
jgi:hypothetical protein